MLTATQIENNAKFYVENNTDIIEKIQKLRVDKNKLFEHLIACAKNNDFLELSYVLNCCMANARERAEFGNQRDSLGNTLYHYAAERGHNEIIVILNDKRKFKGLCAFFLFSIKNNNGYTPLDLVCKRGHLQAFCAIWQRAGKSNHNPLYALASAVEGKCLEIIKIFTSHPKFKIEQFYEATLYQDIDAGLYGEEIKVFFREFNNSRPNPADIEKQIVSKKRNITEFFGSTDMQFSDNDSSIADLNSTIKKSL